MQAPTVLQQFKSHENRMDVRYTKSLLLPVPQATTESRARALNESGSVALTSRNTVGATSFGFVCFYFVYHTAFVLRDFLALDGR
jgi:hypothetical protein